MLKSTEQVLQCHTFVLFVCLILLSTDFVIDWQVKRHGLGRAFADNGTFSNISSWGNNHLPTVNVPTSHLASSYVIFYSAR